MLDGRNTPALAAYPRYMEGEDAIRWMQAENERRRLSDRGYIMDGWAEMEFSSGAHDIIDSDDSHTRHTVAGLGSMS